MDRYPGQLQDVRVKLVDTFNSDWWDSTDKVWKESATARCRKIASSASAGDRGPKPGKRQQQLHLDVQPPGGGPIGPQGKAI